MKIYIIGAPASGKTTLAKKLSLNYKCNYYELDLLVFDDAHDHIKRKQEEIENLFCKILEQENWIIEDVGRSKFKKGIDSCNKIIYIKSSKWQITKRIIIRWIRQRKDLEEYHYPPTLMQLFDMLRVKNSYFKKEKKKLEVLKNRNEKLIIIPLKQIETYPFDTLFS